MNRALTLSTFVLAAAAAPLAAQGKGHGSRGVPPGQRPPAGMCRVWVQGVPPGQQAAPTDCATAERTRPANATIIYGGAPDDGRNRKWDKEDRDEGENHRKAQKHGERDADDDRDDDRNEARDKDRRGTCVDNDRDGRCDGAIRVPTIPTVPAGSTLPDMMGAILIGQGQRSGDVSRWFGSANVTPRYAPPLPGRAPTRVTWLDSAGRTIQIWTDTNGDGRADRVDYLRRGRIVRTVR